MSPTPGGGGGGGGGGFPGGSININIEDARKWGNDRVVFPYPVAPDLLLTSNTDGSLALPDITAAAETTVSPSTAPDASGDPENQDESGGEDAEGDVLFPDFADGDEEDGDEEDDAARAMGMDSEPFWTMPRIALALVAFIVIAIVAYYAYESYAASNGNNGNGNGSKNGAATTTNAGRGNGITNGARGTTSTTSGGNTGNAGRSNSVNIGANALNGLAPPANGLGNLGDFGTGDAGNVDAFGDGFNDFANVNDIGPPPPTGR
jgi:hypothetical protein